MVKIAHVIDCWHLKAFCQEYRDRRRLVICEHAPTQPSGIFRDYNAITSSSKLMEYGNIYIYIYIRVRYHIKSEFFACE